MEPSDLPVLDPREEIEIQRDDLLTLLEALGDDEWGAPTDAGIGG